MVFRAGLVLVEPFQDLVEILFGGGTIANVANATIVCLCDPESSLRVVMPVFPVGQYRVGLRESFVKVPNKVCFST